MSVMVLVILFVATLTGLCQGSGSGNPYQNDIFAPEKIPDTWWTDNVTDLLPQPISRIECSIKCMMLTMEVCNAYIYSEVDGCTLGQLDYVPLYDPPPGFTMIVILYCPFESYYAGKLTVYVSIGCSRKKSG